MSHSDDTRYNFSFTAASLRPELARIVAEHYLASEDWATARSSILSSNALQCRSTKSLVNMERELRQRLQLLTREQLDLLATAPAEDRAAIAWLAAMKRIRFAFEFATEVIRDKLAAQDAVLRLSDYESFVQDKGVSHPEMSELTAKSRQKVRQVLMRMLTEAGLLAPGPDLGMVHRPVLSPSVTHAVLRDSPRWLAGFLVPDRAIEGL